MNKHRIVSLLLIALILSGFFIRFWQLGTHPGSALIDEAHFGYLAYSLLETGKDEHGISWPLIFKGFGDQKLPLYAYSLLPWVKFFGLSVFTIRIPSLLAGALLIWAAYILVYEAFRSKQAALFAAFVTAFSPWPFFLSRFGFEANLSLVFYVFGLAVGLRFIRNPTPFRGILAALLLAIPWYGYIAFRPTSVIIVAAMTVVAWKMRLVDRINLVYFLTAFAVLIFPWFLPSTSASNSTRLSQVSLLGDEGIALEVNEQRNYCSEQMPKVFCYTAFNKPILITQTLVQRYFDVFSPNYLATEGEKSGRSFLTVNRYGQFSPVIYLFFIAGITSLLFYKKIALSTKIVLIIGLLLSALPAIVSGAPQKVRLTPWYPFALLSIAASYYWLITAPFKRYIKSIATLLTIILVLIHFASFWSQFFTVHLFKNDFKYQSYIPELTRYIESLSDDSLVVIKPFYSDAVMFHAFYSRQDPRYYQQNARLGVLEDSGFQHTEQVGRIMAKNIEPSEVACIASSTGYQNAFLVTEDRREDLNIAYQIKSSNGVHTLVYSYVVPLSMCGSQY